MSKGKESKLTNPRIGSTDPIIGVSVSSRREVSHSDDEISHTEWKEIHGEYVEVKICKPGSAMNPIDMGNETKALIGSGKWSFELGFELGPPKPDSLKFGFVKGSLPTKANNPQSEKFKGLIQLGTKGTKKPKDVPEPEGN